MDIGSIIFIVIFLASTGFFIYKAAQIIRIIKMGRSVNRTDNKGERIKTMVRVALGQSKMVTKPIAGIMHIFIYVAFIITQIELIEILVDGFTGEHRIFMPHLGDFYTFVISFIEILSVLALIATLVFLARRNLLKVPRFVKSEMTGWPKLDGNIILYLEFILVLCIFTMNGADEVLRLRGESHAEGVGSLGFAVSSVIGPALFGGMETETLHLLERIGWWGHFLVVMGFLCYLPFSKHLHILWAFPNVYFSNLKPKGQFSNMESVTNEVKLMLDPNADPFAAPAAAEGEQATEPQKFGAKDVPDLTWVQIMNAYTCTECGRCTAACPANITGKKLSPRKIMMDVRDRAEELGAGLRKDKEYKDDKSLIGDYITEEELWACTTCNACVQECPVNIDPLSIIVDLRRYLVMEESKIPAELVTMNTNIENNQAPWQFSPADRLNWKDEA
ncbi:MAG: (Fe-S)-binding protein [Crocinitomicaceae bacterium]|nr:(Fe-S)-binding protein [Crocinitomicaceae bacterium]